MAAKCAHIVSALRNNESFVDATALLSDIQDKAKGAAAVSHALKSAISGRSSTKHIIFSSNTDTRTPVLAYLIQLLMSVCDFVTLSISNISFVGSTDAAVEAAKPCMDKVVVPNASLRTLNLTNLAVRKDVEGSFEALIRSLATGCEHLSINGIAYDTDDGGECRFFRGLAASREGYHVKTIHYIPNVFLNSYLLSNAYGKSDRQMVGRIYAQFLLETLPALFVFLLFVSEGLESISLYLNLTYFDTPQIRACLGEFRAFLLLCSTLRSIKLLLHGDKVDSQLVISDTMGPLPAATNKAFDCLGIYAEYKGDLATAAASVKAAFSEAAVTSPGGGKNKVRLFTNLCSNVFAKLNAPLSCDTREEYCRLLRCTPGAFELFVKLFREIMGVESDSLTFSGRTYTNLVRLSIADGNRAAKTQPEMQTPPVPASLTSSKRVESARRRIGSPTILPVSSLEGSGHKPPASNESYTSIGPMTRSSLRRSDLQNSQTTHVSKTAIPNLTAGVSMQLSNDHLAINTSGPISINDLLTKNSTANNHLRAELHSMLLDILPETQTVKDLTRRISSQEDALIELRNCVLLLSERVGPDALSKDETSYVASVLRGTMVENE